MYKEKRFNLNAAQNIISLDMMEIPHEEIIFKGKVCNETC